jgi:hypothetical protein
MKLRHILVSLLVLSLFAISLSQAQFYTGAFVGFKSSGLKGVIKVTGAGGTTPFTVVDAGKTGFNFGVCVGYQIFPSTVAGGWYKLDLNLDASFTSISYLEAGYNASQIGSGSFAADGLSGGSTTIIALDIMPIHRLNIPKFHLLSPYAGVGLGLNIMSTKDVTVSPPSGNGTLTGNGEMKIGLLVFYGTLIRVSDVVQPYIQFKHLVPFGSETQFTQDYQATGGGTNKVAFSIQDVPSYFNITAGVRIIL